MAPSYDSYARLPAVEGKIAERLDIGPVDMAILNPDTSTSTPFITINKLEKSDRACVLRP